MESRITSSSSPLVSRRAVLRKALGLSAAALAIGAIGPVREVGAQDVSAQQHTSQPYTVTADLNLRSGPGTGYSVILVMPKGSTLTLNAREQNGFLSVNYKGTIGWAHHDYIVPADSGPANPVIIGTASTTTDLNLRSGPSTGHKVLRVLAKGSAVQISNTVQNGFRYAIHQGLAGWAHDAYLTSGGSGEPLYDPNYATTTAALNLRAEASTSAKVLLVMPSGAKVRLLDGYANGFRKVSYNGTTGWAYTAYLN
jgi:D-alanyl-D-alanine carboxypeptidase